jgi:hypothetical protein
MDTDALIELSIAFVVLALLILYRFRTRHYLIDRSTLQNARNRSKLTDIVIAAIALILAYMLIPLFVHVFSGVANAEEVDGSSDVPVIATDDQFNQGGPIQLFPRFVEESVARRKPFFQIVVNAEYWCQWTLHDLAVAREEGGVEFKKIASVFTARIDRTDVWTATYEVCAELELIPKDLEE